MKAALPLALIGALVVGTAYAADTSSSQSGSDQSSMNQSSTMGQKWSADEVKEIQGKLKSQGYKVGSVDGVLGPNTQQALRQFQQDKGIQASGQVDPQTLAALDINPSGVQHGQLPSNAPRNNNATPSGGDSGSGSQ